MKHSILLSLLLLAGTSGAFADIDSIFVSPASQAVSTGQTFTLNINVDSIPDLYDYQFSLSFDPTVLAAQSIAEGSLFADTNDSFFVSGTIDNSSGSITQTYDTLFGLNGVAGPGTLAAVTFTTIGTGATSIDFSPLGDLILQDSLGNSLFVTPASGTVNVTVVPEPATYMMLATGLLLIGLALRRQGTFTKFTRRPSR